jgi:hypothetical protein
LPKSKAKSQSQSSKNEDLFFQEEAEEEYKEGKTISIEDLKKDLSESKELLVSLEKLTFENNQCILNLTMNSTDDYNGDFNEQNMVNLDELQNSELKIDELQDELSYDNGQNEIIGTDLKKLIESELSLDM